MGVLVREDSALADKDCVKSQDLEDMPLITAKRNLVKREELGAVRTNKTVC